MRGASRRPISPPGQIYMLPMVKNLDDNDEQIEYVHKRMVYPDESVTLKTPYAVLGIVLYLLTMAALLIVFEVIKPTLFTDDVLETHQA